MKIQNSIFPLFLLLFLISCNDEKPDSGFGKITVTGFNLQKPNPDARINASENWEHPYPTSITTVFVSQETGESYTIQIPGTVKNTPFAFELPFGSYSYKSPVPTFKISTTLPIELEGNLTVNSPQITTELEGFSRYQLVSIQKTNLGSAPKLLTPESGTLASNGNFYFLYTLESFKTEITLTNGRSFRLGLDPVSFRHQSFFYPKSSTPEPPISLSDMVFELSSQTIHLAGDLFPEVFPPFRKKELGFPLGETSALEDIDGRLFTLNDGGNLPELFEISSESGEFQRIIRITNASNVDWEDLAASDTHIFIGDFGNNLGNRKDLRILKIPILDLFTSTSVTAEILEFSYPDQSSFDDPNHKFDCEALVFWNGKLHLFTKPVNVNETSQYTLDPSQKIQVASKVSTFPTPGKITGADVTSDGKNLILLGYEIAGINSRSFIQAFTGLTPGQAVLNSPFYTIYLGNVSQTSQTEGIAIQSVEKIKISGEQISIGGFTIPPRLFEIDLKGVLAD